MGPDGPKWGQEDLFPTNPDLADILGRTDFDFEIFFFWIPDFQVPRNLAWAKLGPGLGRAWAGLGQGWAGLGPGSGGPPILPNWP